VTSNKQGTQCHECASTQKKCEACGEMFTCGAPEPGCWCEAAKLTSEAAAQLRAHHTDCLCPRCLAAAAGASDV
jgi:cysteine-rich CWC protein